MKFLKLIKINAFELVYLAIAIATFQHTTWAAATVFEGPKPEIYPDVVIWYLMGALIAVAIDIGMLVTARSVAHKFNFFMFFTFVVVALVSGFYQMIYAYSHTAKLEPGPGISQYWMETLNSIIDAGFLLSSLALPLMATIYTLASIFTEQRKQKEVDKANKQWYYDYEGETFGPFKNERGAKMSATRMLKENKDLAEFYEE